MYYLINNGRTKFLESVIHDPSDVAREIAAAATRSTSRTTQEGSSKSSEFGRRIRTCTDPDRRELEWLGWDAPVKSAADIASVMNVPSTVARRCVDAVYGEIELKSTPIGRVKRRSVLSEESGHSIDISRALAGDPRIWIDTAKQRTKTPLMVTILINNAANCRVTAEDMAIPVSAASVLADRLDNCGVRTEIYTVAETREHNDKLAGARSVRCVKQFADTASRYSIAARSGPQSFRSVDVMLMSATTQYQSEWDVKYGLGYTSGEGIPTEVVKRLFPENRNRKVVTMPSIRNQVEAVAYVNKTIAELTGQ